MSFSKAWSPDVVAKMKGTRSQKVRQPHSTTQREKWRAASARSREHKAWKKSSESAPQPGLQSIWARWAQIRATKRYLGHVFTVWPEDMAWPEMCPALGISLDYTGRDKQRSWSLDRLDSTKGYVVGNVSVISLRANRIKNNATLGELEAIAAWMRQQCENP